MNGKHEIGCDCRGWMIYRAEDASSRALRTRDFEPRLINNVESLVDHATESQDISVVVIVIVAVVQYWYW